MTDSETAVVAENVAQDRRVWAARVGVMVVLGLLGCALIRLIAMGWFHVGYPYELDYGEGIVWQQMTDVVAGRGYAPIGVFPAIVFHYPPVYHLAVAAAAWVAGGDGLAAGRAVSLAATLVSVGLVGRLAFAAMPGGERRRVRVLASLVAAGCAASAPTIVTWASYMRVDMLAGALSLAGLALTLRAAERPVRIAAAAVCFVLAVYTKQTSVAAPAAAFVALWLARPRAAWMLFAWCMGLGLCALVVLSIATQGEFVRHVLLYNLNRVDPSRGLLLLSVVLFQIVTIAVAALAVGTSWARLRPSAFGAMRGRIAVDPNEFAVALMLAFLILKTAMLPTILKSGANDNYLIEWLYGVAVFVGIGAVPVIRAAEGGAWPRPLLVALVLVGLPIQVGRSLAAGDDRAELTAREAVHAGVIARIARSPKPVIADDMVLLIRGGQPVRWEPAIAAELGHAGLYDEAAFARIVWSGRFGFFVTVGDRGGRLYDERYNPVVADAIDAAYPHRERHGYLVLHLPR
ncbi:hypothetical protein [uncultured Sphingomonas sp.]|uniref:hypothetical protein n=1 Tax=uncultured Sphingomonas sp. TaxID=158754 RepID=UPI0035CA3752